MSERHYPNESPAYRDARDALLKDEQELVDKVKAVAAKRRTLPLGGQLKEDYVFQWANDGKIGKSVKFSELFVGKNTLLLYSFMFGPNWDKPCPSCTSLVDGFDRSWYQVNRDAAFAAIAKAPAERIDAWAKERGWSQIPLVSGFASSYPGRLQMPGRIRRHAVAGDARLHEAGRQDLSLLGHRAAGRITSTRCGRTGISWTSRPRGGPTFPRRRRTSGRNSWRSTTLTRSSRGQGLKAAFIALEAIKAGFNERPRRRSPAARARSATAARRTRAGGSRAPCACTARRTPCRARAPSGARVRARRSSSGTAPAPA